MMFTAPDSYGARPTCSLTAGFRGIADAIAAATPAQPSVGPSHNSPDAIAHAFGLRLQREFGNDWARLIGIAAGAAMAADHGEVG